MKHSKIVETYWLNLKFESPLSITMCCLIGDDIHVLLIKRIES